MRGMEIRGAMEEDREWKQEDKKERSGERDKKGK